MNEMNDTTDDSTNVQAAAAPALDDDADFFWPPLESNPEVFNAYMHEVGMSPDFCFSEVLGLDEESLHAVPQPVYGVVVILQRLHQDNGRKKGSARNLPLVDYSMKQAGTLDNCCGLVACLHVLLNSPVIVNTLRPHSLLANFQQATIDKSPAERCQLLENNVAFRAVHQRHAVQGQSEPILRCQSRVRHAYVAFVVRTGGTLIELDGVQQGPHVICGGRATTTTGTCSSVLTGTAAELQRRLAAGEISYQVNLLALHKKVVE